MTTGFSDVLLALGQAYLALGFLLAIAFVLFGVERIDPAARGTYVFRALLIPGLTLLWPVVAARWAGLLREPEGKPTNRDMSRHFVAWICLAVVIPVVLVAAVLERRVSLPRGASQQISSSEARP